MEFRSDDLLSYSALPDESNSENPLWSALNKSVDESTALHNENAMVSQNMEETTQTAVQDTPSAETNSEINEVSNIWKIVLVLK